MPQSPLESIVANIVRETVPHSIRLRVAIEQTNRRASAAKSSANLTLKQVYMETDHGERYLDEVRLASGQAQSHERDYCNGAKCANVRFTGDDLDQQETIGIGREFRFEARFGFRDAPPPLRYYHVGLTPLHEALAHAEREGREDVIGRPCDIFVFKGVGRGAEGLLVYSLDAEATIPLKVAFYSRPDQRAAHAPNWTWEASSFDKTSGRYFVLSSTGTSYRVKKSDDGQWSSEPTLSRTIQVEEIAFDTPIPKSTFWPVVQPGARVDDTIAKRHYMEAGETAGTQGPAALGPPIRVEPESGSWIAPVGTALSLAVLLVAAVLWKRSR